MGEAKIRVVHIITLLELGGAQQNTLHTVKALDRSRFDLTLIAGKGGILDEEALNLPRTEVLLLEDLVRPIHPVKDLKAVISLRNILKERMGQGPIMVHTHSGKAGVVGRIAAKLAGVKPVIHHIHGLSYPKLKKGLFAPMGRFIEMAVDPFTHGFISVCHANLRDGGGFGLYQDRENQVIRSGFDVEGFISPGMDQREARLQLDLDPNRPVVGMIACFKAQKNPLEFVRMAAGVLEKAPHTQFIVAGDGRLKPQMHDLARALNVTREIRFLGWRRDIPRLLQAMDVLTLFSLWEGLPRVAPQALLTRTPVVATDVDGVSEVIRHGENGYLIPPRRPEEAAPLVLKILQTRGSCLSPGPLPETVKRDFDQDLMVRRQEAFYLRMLSC